MHDFSIRISSVKQEGILQASKWLKTQVLLDADEMTALLAVLGSVYFVQVASPIPLQEALLTKEQFLIHYENYISALQKGKVPEDASFRSVFSSILTNDLSSLYALPAGGDRFLIKSTKPVIQLQAHQFFYSQLDGIFHPMVLSRDSVSWGIQFSYPQWVQDPKSHQIQKVGQHPEFSNTATFSSLMRWMRSFTLPTPFFVDQRKVNAPLRIGKKCLSWIENHPQLKQKGITVGL